MDDTTAAAQPLVVVGSYAPAAQPGIHVFRFDDATGALTACGSFAGVVNPSFLIVHPNRRWLYAVSETSQQDGAPGSVWALRFEYDPVSIQPANHRPSGGDSPCHLQLDSSGKWLLVSNYGSGKIGARTHIDTRPGAGPRHIAFQPSGQRMYVAHELDSTVSVYDYEASNGALFERQSIETTPPDVLENLVADIHLSSSG